MRAYSTDLRERIVRAVEAGTPRGEVARRFAVSPTTVRRYLRQRRQSGDLTPRRSPGRPPRIGPAQAAALRDLVARHPDATLAEHCARWEQATGQRISVATMSRAIRKQAITIKKSPARR